MQPAPANCNSDIATEVQRPPSHFRDNATLQSLVAPVSETDFFANYWEKKPLIIHRQDPHYYGDLFTLKDFDESITRGPNYVKTAEAVTNKQAKHFGATPTALERILSNMHEGYTLILDGMHQFEPKLKTVCSRLGQETGYVYQANIYLTPPNGKGFSPHWDNHDVFILQVLGSKHWKVEEDRRTLPEKNANIEDEGREFRGDVYDFTLEQGDIIYIPRGFVHAAECGSNNSLHITLGAYFPTWDELLSAAVRMAALEDEKLRYALPPGYGRADGTIIRNRMQDALRRMSDATFLTHVLEQFCDEHVKKAPLDISGQVQSFFEPKPLTLHDQISPRDGLFFTVRTVDNSIRLNVGTRTIAFPDFLGPALHFALTTPNFMIRDLPGDLEDEEKTVFIERLILEALVIRK